MGSDLDKRAEAGVMELVNGIIADVHALVKQQLALFQHEFKSDILHAQAAGVLMAVGLALAVMGGVLLCGMLVHLLALWTPSIPLWGCYGIVGGPVVAIGAILCLAGLYRFK